MAEATYKVSDANIETQLAKLKASGADIFLQFTTPKFATIAIKRSAELGWRPNHFVASVSNSYTAVIQPAGPQNAEGVMSAAYRLEGEDAADLKRKGCCPYSSSAWAIQPAVRAMANTPSERPGGMRDT